MRWMKITVRKSWRLLFYNLDLLAPVVDFWLARITIIPTRTEYLRAGMKSVLSSRYLVAF